MKMKFVSVIFVLLAQVGFAEPSFEAGCSQECRTPRQELTLFVPDAEHMCPDSDLYGKALETPFVSRTWETGSDSDVKTWQLRTITVYDTQNRPWHLLFPFVLSTGGITYVGANAASVLKEFGAQRRPDYTNDPSYCRLELRLPLGSTKCLGQGEPGRYDDDNDIRNNMIGASDAAVILTLDSFATGIAGGIIEKEAVLRTLMEQYPGAKYEDIKQELDLLLKAPISKKFSPPYYERQWLELTI